MRRIFAILSTILVALLVGITNTLAAPIDVLGDVFVGAGGGQVFQYTPDGTLVQKLSSGFNSETTGMAFDASGKLYSTNFQAQAVVVYDQNGTKLGTFGSGFNADPESIVFDKSGNAFVGQADGTHNILEFNSAGTLIKTIVPTGGTDRGTDWIDLSSNQTTLFYAGEGSHIRTVDAVTGATSTFTSNGDQLFALRLLPDGSILAADGSNQVVLFDSSGNKIKTYTIGGSELFALNLDPDGTSFWTGDIGGTTGIWRVDIATGNILAHWNASKDGATEVAGVAVFGEITQGGGGPGGGTPVPEPASMALFASGLIALAAVRRRRR